MSDDKNPNDDDINFNEVLDDSGDFDQDAGPSVTEDEFESYQAEETFDDVSFDNEFTDEIDDYNDDDLSATSYTADEYNEINDTPKSTGGMNWFNIGIVAFAIIGIAGISYMYLPSILSGGQKPAQEQPPQIASPEQQQQLAQQAANGNQQTDTPQNNTPVFEGGLLNNPDALRDESSDATNPDDLFAGIENIDAPASDEITSLLGDLDTTESQTPSAPQQSTETRVEFDELPLPADNDVTPLDAFDYTNLLNEADTMPSAPVAEVVETQQPTPNVPSALNTTFEVEPQIDESPTPTRAPQQQVPNTMPARNYDADIAALNTRMDDMNSSMTNFMQSLDGKLSAIANNANSGNTAPAPQQSAETTQILNDLQKSVARLENKVSSLESQPAPAAKTTSTPKAEAKQTASTPKAATPKKASTPAPKKAEKAYVPPKVTYDLRGASPGQAVLADKGTQNIRTVSVGDVVRGLGTVQSIAIENGRWVVRGSSGSVYQ